MTTVASTYYLPAGGSGSEYEVEVTPGIGGLGLFLAADHLPRRGR